MYTHTCTLKDDSRTNFRMYQALVHARASAMLSVYDSAKGRASSIIIVR